MARKKKESPNPGLTPPAMREQIEKELADVEALQGVRKPNTTKNRTLLSKARKGSPGDAGSGGVFGAAPVQDSGRDADRGERSVPDAERDGGHGLADASITEILRLIVYGQDRFPMDNQCPPIVAILRKVVYKATHGEQAAIDFVTNRIEGKPGQAARKTTTLEDVEANLDHMEKAALDQFVTNLSPPPTEEGTE